MLVFTVILFIPLIGVHTFQYFEINPFLFFVLYLGIPFLFAVIIMPAYELIKRKPSMDEVKHE